jgi:uncharacterized membrane protein YhaH (DUF805 family)
MGYMLMPIRRYVDFSGRSRRREYWLWTLFVLLGYVAIYILGTLLLTGSIDEIGDPDRSPGTLLVGLFGLFIMIPSLAVVIRRLHDLDKSGWWYFLALVPLIGPLILLVWFLTAGTPGPNRFGPDPKGRAY